MMNKICAAFAIGLLGLFSSHMLHAQPQATVLKETSLLAEPSFDAQELAKLPVNTNVQVLDAKGGWLHAKAPSGEGYVRRFHVRLASLTTQTNHANAIPTLITGRQGRGIVATMGIRGLDREKLAHGSFNAQELAKLESLTVSPEKARQEAMAKGLTARMIQVKQ